MLSNPQGVTLASSSAAVSIQDDVPAPRSDFVKVSSIDSHTCAVTVGGAAFCWGYSNFGNIGDGTQLNRGAPTPVAGLSSGVTDIMAGNYGSCAITGGGAAQCWGLNDYSADGDGTTTNQTAPVAVVGLSSGVLQIARGYEQTCALLTGGIVNCWGMNLYGQLGNGTNTDSATPVIPIGLSSGVTQISVNFHGACGLRARERSFVGVCPMEPSGTVQQMAFMDRRRQSVRRVSPPALHKCPSATVLAVPS